MSKIATVGFVYRGPHHVHKAFAESVEADFFSNWLVHKFKRIPLAAIPLAFIARNVTLPKRDIYLCEDGYSLIIARCRTLLSPRSKIVILVASPFYHNILRYPSIIRTLFNIFIFRKVSYAFTVSEMYSKEIQQYLTCPVSIVYPFVDLDRFPQCANTSSNNLCTVGVVRKQKNIRLLLEAFSHVYKVNPKARLTVCGPWSEEPGIIESEHPGCVFTKKFSDPIEYFKRSSIYLFTPTFDSCSVAVLQAMAAGLIPIVTSTSGSSEIVRDVDSSLVVKPGAQQIAEKIQYILSMSSRERLEVSQRTRLIAEKYARNKSIAKFQREFNRTLKKIY